MDSFKDHITVNEDLKFIDLLPPKIRHALKRYAHADKYKGALKMYRELKKNKDIKKRNLPDNRIKGIAADFFKLSHREFDKVLDRKTRYEDVEDWEINEEILIEGVKSHFLYQDDRETRLGKTKRVLFRGTEKECKDKIFSWSRGFIHKGRDFSIWKGKFNKERYFDPSNNGANTRVDFKYDADKKAIMINRKWRKVKTDDIGNVIGESIIEEILTEGFTIAYKKKSDITHLGFSPEQEGHIKDLYNHLIKMNIYDNPLIFPTDKKDKSRIKINTIFQSASRGEKWLNSLTHGDDAIAPSLNKRNDTTMLEFGKGSASKQKTVDVAAFGIKNDTKFFEFWQAIGLFISKPLTASNFKKMLTKLTINGDFKIREFITDGQKGWDKFIDYCVLDPEVGADVRMLVNGSYYYRNSIKPAIFSNNAFVIWHDIKDYYTALKTKEGIEGTVKENTADCVLVNGDKQKLYDALKSNKPIITDDKTGMLTCNNVEWYQISLKKAKGDARLGKLTKLLRGLYKTPDNLDAAEVSNLFDEVDYDYEQVLQEGLFGDIASQMKEIGGDAFKKFKAGAVAVFKYWQKLKGFIGKLAKKYEKDAMKEIDRLTKKSLREQLILEKATTKDKLSAIVNDKTKGGLNDKYVKIINKNYKSLPKNMNTDYVTTNVKPGKVEITPTSINFLVGNVISMKIVNDVIDDVDKNGIKVINKLTQSMSMGDTELPVVKVYGTTGTDAEYEVVTIGSITQTNPMLNKEQIKILKVAVQPFKEYYVINMWIFAELKEDGPHYHQVAFKKSGSSSFNYNIEGTTTIPGTHTTLTKLFSSLEIKKK